QGAFSLTEVGAALRRDTPGSMRGWVMFVGSQMYVSTSMNLSYAVRTGKAAFEQTHGVSFFDFIARQPENQKIFDGAMTACSGPEAEAVVAAFDFASLGRLVHVGGGHGTLLAQILKANPKLRGAVFEQPQVLTGARANLAQQGLAERCDFIAGSFFESVPSGYD